MIPGIVISCLVAVCFIALGIWFLVQGIKPIVPTGHTYTTQIVSSGIRVNIVLKNTAIVDLKAVAKLEGRLPQYVFRDAVASTCQAWGNTYNVDPKKVLDNMYIVFYDDASWNKALVDVGYGEGSGVVAFQNYVPQRVGKGPVQINIQASQTATDHLVIHEVLHALLAARLSKDPDALHVDSLVWANTHTQGIETSAQIISGTYHA